MTDAPDPLLSDDLGVSLSALRDLLVSRLRAAKPNETAPIARQLSLVIQAIAGLPGKEKSAVDELEKAREKRRAAAQKRSRAAHKRGSGSGQSRKASGTRAGPVAGGSP